jgi:ParB-like nuclease domain
MPQTEEAPERVTIVGRHNSEETCSHDDGDAPSGQAVSARPNPAANDDEFLNAFLDLAQQILEDGSSKATEQSPVVEEEPPDERPALKQPELAHVQVRSLDSIRPAPENDDLYNAIAFDDPGIIELARSIKERGLQEPILVSSDGYIISGHRCRIAAHLAELVHVQVLVHPVSRIENKSEFLKLLVEMNSQRIKSTSELVHETLIKVDPKAAHQKIVNDRKQKDEERSCIDLSEIDPIYDGRRCDISPAKYPLLAAIRKVLEEQGAYWPLSVRQIHYRLLGPDAPLIHASKPESRYANNIKSYRAAIDIAACGRVLGSIPWEAIDDETRPIELNQAFENAQEFFGQEFRNFLTGYWRNRLQSQPHHIESVVEKLTVQSILQPVAREHTMPLTIMRGMNVLPPKRAIYERYKRSRKRRLILLVVTDLDPAGDAIAEDLVKSFRRDFGIYEIEAYKVALSLDQVDEFSLEPSMEAKKTSPTYDAFVEKYGITNAYELESMEPSDLAASLESAIENVLDLDPYNQELAAEEADSAQIIAVQEQAAQFFKSLNLNRNQ